jgi:thiamine-monophosphate kinase
VKLESLGEFGLIGRIEEKVSSGKGVITGIGDDAAVTELSPGMQLLTSTDMLLEDVHFRRNWHDSYRLGRKSLAVSISDIAAMGGIPRWALLSLALPSDLPFEDVDAFTDGFLAMAAEHGVSLIGGDTCSSKAGLIVSVTIMGEQLPELIVRRDSARPGDDIWVTGTLGDAARGLNLLESGAGGDEYLVSRLLDPTPRSLAGRSLAEAGLVTAMIDVSDGMLSDFGHIAELSGVGGNIYLERLPASAQLRKAVESLPLFPYNLMLSGGEDYELAFTAPPENREKISNLMKKSGVTATPVGIVTSQSGINVLRPDGTHYILQKHGFNHFK